MKSKTKLGLLAFFSLVLLTTVIIAGVSFLPAYAVGDSGNITCAKSPAFDSAYLSAYSIPTSMFTYENNGGGTIANAFDGNWNSSWISAKDNNVGGHLNRITLSFNTAVTINRILYASDNTRTGYGYPTRLRIYYANGQEEMSLYGECASSATADRVVFTLDEAITAQSMVFEYVTVNTSHKYVASAKEIQFLQPENDSVNSVLQLFTDYTQFVVRDEYKSQIGALRENVKDFLSYQSVLKPLLDRAETVVNGEATRDDRFEFSTDPNAQNIIFRRGNLIGYAKDVLKINVYGYTTNRQVTGIGGLCGSTVTVYVDAPNSKDPLPSIVITQASGDWHNWKRSYSLTRGKNVLAIPQFIVEANGAGGGPIYIDNPYTQAQQSANVKIYIEGGFLYPTYRLGDDEEVFKEQLKEYEEKRLTNPTGIVDVCEIVGNHFINTSKSSYAYNHYINGSVSPAKNVDVWEKFMTGMLAFDGVSMDPADKYFDERNLYLPVNFRLAHWSGYGAYAMNEHIGLVSLGHSQLTNMVSPGWGLSHEIGHMMDLGERTRAETTNNMWAVYGDLLMSNTMNTGKAQHIVSPAVLYPDETATDYNYYHTNVYSISQWWNLEVAYPGFWGRLDNTYRYYDRKSAFAKAGVTAEEQAVFNNAKTEKMVYFSSIATGIDLGYYYERYGFAYESAPFKVATASSAYTKLVAQAIKDGVLSTKQYKYWYFDINQYFHDVNERACYSLSDQPSISDIWNNNGQYTLVLPAPADADRHLGYEIKEYRNGNWYVIGFIRSQSFTDATAYPEGYTPRYKVCAYDRQLNSTSDSEEKSCVEFVQTNVCRLGDAYYNSLAEAVTASSSGDTIYLLCDTRENGITTSKNLTILPDPSLTSDVTIRRHSTNAMFTLNGGIIIMGAQGDDVQSKIILDGFSFSQGSPLITLNSATFKLYNVVLRNNVNTGNGGAISVSSSSGKLYLTNCELVGNSAVNGGAIYNVGTTNVINSKLIDNVASNNGGAVANFSGGILAVLNSTFSGNKANNSGGAFAIDGRTGVTDSIVQGNSAKNLGGGYYIASSGDNRYVEINGGNIVDNSAGKGGAIYLQKGILYIGVKGLTISGEFYKDQGTLRLKTGDSAKVILTDATFRLSSIGEDTVLFSAYGNGVAFTDELLSTVRVYLGSASLNDNKTGVLVNKAVADITLNVNGQNVRVEHTVGWTYTLPEAVESAEIPSDKEFDCWEINGVKYNAGDSVVISEAVEIRAVLKDKPAPTPDDPVVTPDNPIVNPDPDNPSTNPENPPKEVNAVGLAVGLSVGVAVLSAGAVAVWLVIKRKKSAK